MTMPLTSQPVTSTKVLNEKTDKENDATYPAEQLPPAYRVLPIYAYLEVLCGCLAILAGFCAYVLGTWRSEYGIGVWSGILFVASGVTGLIAKHRRGYRTLLCFFCVSAFIAGTAVTVIIFHIVTFRNEDLEMEERLFNFPRFSQGERRGLDALQTILALVAFIILLSGCRSVYKHLCRDYFQTADDRKETSDANIQLC